MLKLKRFTNKDDQAWADWPALRRAIEEAAVQFGQKSIATVLDRILASFAIEGHASIPAEQQGTTAVWYVVDETGVIRAHLVAVEDAWDGGRCVYVNQLWAPHMPQAMIETALEELDHYTRSRGASQVFMYTRRDCERARRLWHKKFGFLRYRGLYRREIR